VNIETMLPQVTATSSNTVQFTEAGLRSGIDKLTLVRHPIDEFSGGPLLVTNQFLDTVISNGMTVQQSVERVIRVPDVLFSSADLTTATLSLAKVDRTGTSNWLNCAHLNASAVAAGPGVIQPPIKIIFHQLGPRVDSWGLPPDSVSVINQGWGSFRDPTNSPQFHPDLECGDPQSVTIHFGLFLHLGGWRGDEPAPSATYRWHLEVEREKRVSFQISSNLHDWYSVATLTNNGGVMHWRYCDPSQSRQFFRVVPE
jgi:hypothetical protein